MALRRHRQAQPLARERAVELRQSLSLPEILLWTRLRRQKSDGVRWWRQHPIGPYIADFFCHDAMLVVEVDGLYAHRSRLHQDQRRDDWMAQRDFAVVRVAASRVLQSPDALAVELRDIALNAIRLRPQQQPAPK